MTREELIEYLKSKLKKKAITFETGGIRPTNQLGESWIGKVCWQLPGEQQPIGNNGYPMTAIATIFVPESDHVPNALKNIKMISIFIDDDFWDNLDDDDLKDYFVIRTYDNLNNLVACDYHDHEMLLSFPLVPQYVEDDFPNWSDLSDINRSIFDIIYNLEDKKVLDYHTDIYENNGTSHKLGGYPFSIQDSVDFDEGYEFVLQIASDEKADMMIVDNGKFYFAYNPQTNDWSVKCQFY